jgi:hypothetical protein
MPTPEQLAIGQERESPQVYSLRRVASLPEEPLPGWAVLVDIHTSADPCRVTWTRTWPTPEEALAEFRIFNAITRRCYLAYLERLDQRPTLLIPLGLL